MSEEVLPMKIANTNDEELSRFSDVLTEIVSLADILQHKHFNEISEDFQNYLEELPILKGVLNGPTDDSCEDFFLGVCELIESINHPKLCLILDTLIDNCTDKDSDTIDFSPEIKKALELQEGKPMNSIRNIHSCGSCGSYIKEMSKYCYNCGMKVLKGENDAKTDS